MLAIWLLNDIFKINAKMVVLVAPSLTGADPESPDSAYVVGGKTLYTGVSNVNLTTDSTESEKSDFLIVRKSAHFITVI
jgi:hypothetical protein